MIRYYLFLLTVMLILSCESNTDKKLDNGYYVVDSGIDDVSDFDMEYEDFKVDEDSERDDLDMDSENPENQEKDIVDQDVRSDNDYIEEDPCIPNPCSGKLSRCEPEENERGYKCLCPEGWTGEKCEECESGYFGEDCQPCNCVNGECDDGVSGLGFCWCDENWLGLDCSAPVYFSNDNSLIFTRNGFKKGTWFEAAEYCRNLEYAGFSDWRLPLIDEMRMLVEGCESSEPEGDCELSQYTGFSLEGCDGCKSGEGPAGGCYWPEIYGKECTDSFFWSSSYFVQLSMNAYTISYKSGMMSNEHKESEGLIICVKKNDFQ